MMVLPYTPLQHARLHVEEAGEPAADARGLPVVCCSLHSQVAPVCAALGGLRVAYVQLAGGALPVSLSDTVRALRERGLLGVDRRGRALLRRRRAVRRPSPRRSRGRGAGARRGGLRDRARDRRHRHAASATAGSRPRRPRTPRSRSAAVPVIAVRASGADERERHRGVSITPKRCCARPRRRGRRRGRRRLARGCAGLPLSHMGRGPDEDPEFFAAAYAAGVAARKLARPTRVAVLRFARPPPRGDRIQAGARVCDAACRRRAGSSTARAAPRS